MTLAIVNTIAGICCLRFGLEIEPNYANKQIDIKTDILAIRVICFVMKTRKLPRGFTHPTQNKRSLNFMSNINSKNMVLYFKKTVIQKFL